MHILRKSNVLKFVALLSMLLAVIIIPALAAGGTPENATWTTYGDFSSNASTSGYKTTPHAVRASGNVSTDGSNVNLVGVSRDSIGAGGYHSAALKPDGTVVATGNNAYGQTNVSTWSGIRDISTGLYHTIGVKNDGTVFGVGRNTNGQINVSSWTGIIDAAAGDKHTVGLKGDGTAVAVGANTQGQLNISSWTNIKDVAVGTLHSVGLKNDGTVVSAGKYQYLDGTLYDPAVSAWTDVVAIAAGDSTTFGVKSDGTVIATGLNDKGQLNVAGWSNIVAVSVADSHTVGLKKDGTVIAIGDNTYGQNNVSSWTNIVAVSAGFYHTVGLKADGTMVVTGSDNATVGTWTGIKMPEVSYFASGALSNLTIFKTGSATWNTLSWTGSTPAGTSLKFRTRGADNQSDLPSAAWSAYYTTSGASLSQPDSRWLEVEATLETTDNTVTPTLNDVTVNYTPVVDSTSPAVTAVYPSGDIYTDSATVVAYYNDPLPSSGINTAAVAVYLDGAQMSGCDVTDSSASCTVYGLAVGGHDITGTVSDNAGNSTAILGGFMVVDNVPPVVSNVKPDGTIYSDSATVSAYYTDPDPSSGIDVSSATIEVYGGTVTGCSATVSDISCNVTNLSGGDHVISGSISDIAGNSAAISGYFTVGDTVAPVITDIQPTGTIPGYSAVVSAYYEDASPSSGIVPTSATLEVYGGSVSGCTADLTHISCNATGLSAGLHEVNASVADYNGNVGYGTGSFTSTGGSDVTPPSITDIQPTGTIMTESATVSAYYSDMESGINPASASVVVYGGSVASCAAYPDHISCGVTDLGPGSHLINVRVEDNAANVAYGSGSFEVFHSAPHGTYTSSTDFCLTCHDVHQSAGDYVLMRDPTVTETCGTCHALYGAGTGDGTWTTPPPDIAPGSPTGSSYGAYKNIGASRVSGHRLGVQLNGEANRVNDNIPGGTIGLRVLRSNDLIESENLYDNEDTTSFAATNGLYCNSCHTPHGSPSGHNTDPGAPNKCYQEPGGRIKVASGGAVADRPCPNVADVTFGSNVYKVPGDTKTNDNVSPPREDPRVFQLVVDEATPGIEFDPKNVAPDRLLSAMPNHTLQLSNGAPINSYNKYCMACHDLQGNLSGEPALGEHNHPPLCVSCHSNGGGDRGIKDFPHSSGNYKLLSTDSDMACGCHTYGNLP